MLRIIAGTWRGRKLQVPDGRGVRPTTDRVREALFSMLHHVLEWDGKLVLDLFAGSGALGLEALSRGADRVIWLEPSRRHLQVLRQNLDSLRVPPEQAEVLAERAERWLPTFDNPEQRPCVVFLDPPYQSNLYEVLFPLLSASSAFPEGSWMVVESPVEKTLAPPPNWKLQREKTYGTIRIQLLQKHAPEQLTGD